MSNDLTKLVELLKIQRVNLLDQVTHLQLAYNEEAERNQQKDAEIDRLVQELAALRADSQAPQAAFEPAAEQPAKPQRRKARD